MQSRIALVVDSLHRRSSWIDRYGMYVVPLQVNHEHESFLDKGDHHSSRGVRSLLSHNVCAYSAVARNVLERVVADSTIARLS